MMSMENLSLIMIGLVIAVFAAGGAYLALRVWAGRMVDSDHPNPRSDAARATRDETSRPVRGRGASAHLQARDKGPVV